MQRSGFQLRFSHRFSCEMKLALQAWISSVVRGSAQADFCLLERAEDMGKLVANCVRYAKMCPVPRVDLLIFGIDDGGD